MNDTSFYPSDEQLSRLAGLYGQKDGKLAFADYALIGPTKDARHPIPAGGLFSTGSDLAKLYQAMLNRGWLGVTKLGDKRILSEAGVQADDAAADRRPAVRLHARHGLWLRLGRGQGAAGRARDALAKARSATAARSARRAGSTRSRTCS